MINRGQNHLWPPVNGHHCTVFGECSGVRLEPTHGHSWKVIWHTRLHFSTCLSLIDLNAAKAREVAARIQSGTVWINSHGGVHPMIPFGGAKQSGYGLEFGVEGLKALGVPQVING